MPHEAGKMKHEDSRYAAPGASREAVGLVGLTERKQSSVPAFLADEASPTKRKALNQ
jgi:hypothetical protein